MRNSRIFSARQHICYSALYAIARPSVRLSVCPSHGWISQRRLKLGSRNLHHRVVNLHHDSSFLTPNGTLKFQREDRERGCQIREGYEKTPFSATAGIVFRFTRRRCYRVLTVALAGLSCCKLLKALLPVVVILVLVVILFDSGIISIYWLIM